MGRELHDSTAQTLVALQLQVMYLKEMFDDPRYRGALSKVEQSIHDLHEEIRAVSFVNSLPPLQAGMLPAALRILSTRFGRMTNLRISYRSRGAYAGLPVAAESSLYRIAQEALANVYRHARASNVQVRLETTAGALRLTIEDDGVGIRRKPRHRGGGVGLQNIRMRVRELSGRFECRRLKDGTRFSVTIPRSREIEPSIPWASQSH